MTATLPADSDTETAVPQRFSARKVLGSQFFGASVVAVLVVVAWEVVSGLTFVIPSPLQTLTVLLENLSDPA